MVTIRATQHRRRRPTRSLTPSGACALGKKLNPSSQRGLASRHVPRPGGIALSSPSAANEKGHGFRTSTLPLSGPWMPAVPSGRPPPSGAGSPHPPTGREGSQERLWGLPAWSQFPDRQHQPWSRVAGRQPRTSWGSVGLDGEAGCALACGRGCPLNPLCASSCWNVKIFGAQPGGAGQRSKVKGLHSEAGNREMGQGAGKSSAAYFCFSHF